MSDPSKKGLSIPAWQKQDSENKDSSAEHPHGSDPTTQLSHHELLDQARDFLKDESIQNAPRERKIAFLQNKGISNEDIEQLLGETSTAPSPDHTEELKTVHDSNKSATVETEPSSSESKNHTAASPAKPQLQQRDAPPIITYPEFLLKPQKPPPLITFSRLVNATYAFAGLATLTYGASKYIVEPMLENLTAARRDFASTTLADLEKFNSKLETTVSHVPYIANASSRKTHNHNGDVDAESDTESVTSDPTELFHRDIATQTTPTLSRSPSQSSPNSHLDETTNQVLRLSSLHDTLVSLVTALDPKEVPYLPAPPAKKLHETIADFQAVLDRLESTYNPFRGDYYSSIYAQPTDKSKSTGSSKQDGDVAAKVRSEIRNLKGAFLSARNFPTAPRPTNTYAGR